MRQKCRDSPLRVGERYGEIEWRGMVQAVTFAYLTHLLMNVLYYSYFLS